MPASAEDKKLEEPVPVIEDNEEEGEESDEYDFEEEEEGDDEVGGYEDEDEDEEDDDEVGKQNLTALLVGERAPVQGTNQPVESGGYVEDDEEEEDDEDYAPAPASTTATKKRPADESPEVDDENAHKKTKT